jgi:hypothetical protein
MSKTRDSGLLSGAYNYSNLEPSQELGQVTIASLSQEQERHSFNSGASGGLMGNVKQENRPLRPFFDEWPATTRDSWSEMDDARSNRSSFSTTQLSISIPRCESLCQLSTPENTVCIVGRGLLMEIAFFLQVIEKCVGIGQVVIQRLVCRGVELHRSKRTLVLPLNVSHKKTPPVC